MDNRHALVVDCRVTQADGYGEREAAKAMAADLPGAHQKTMGADKNYDTRGFVAEMRRLCVTPHVAQNSGRSGGSAIDRRTTRHEGYAKSINARRGIEKVFGWIKQFGGLRQFKLRGQGNVSAVFGLHVIAYNLIRLSNLLTGHWRRWHERDVLQKQEAGGRISVSQGPHPAGHGRTERLSDPIELPAMASWAAEKGKRLAAWFFNELLSAPIPLQRT
jgi:hypothetical protein